MPTRSKARPNAPSPSFPPQPLPVIAANRSNVQTEFNNSFASLAATEKILAGLTDGTTAEFKSVLLDFLEGLVRRTSSSLPIYADYRCVPSGRA
jgi:hypothetical protein